MKTVVPFLILWVGFAFGEEEKLIEQFNETVKEVTSFTAKAEAGNAKLHVELYTPKEKEITTVENDKGEFVGFKFQDTIMVEGFWKGRTVIKKFALEWEGKKIEIPERFWKDVGGFIIQTTSLNPEKLEAKERWSAEEFLTTLHQPRVIISADGGTIMIEWQRHEECDGSSTIRWIISKSGAVMRHRHTPPHEC